MLQRGGGRTLYRLDIRLKRSLNLTTVPILSWVGRGSTDLVTPRRRLPRCQPMAMALLPAGHGCKLCTWTENSNRVAFNRFWNFASMVKRL